jgi:hypothetical protein
MVQGARKSEQQVQGARKSEQQVQRSGVLHAPGHTHNEMERMSRHLG